MRPPVGRDQTLIAFCIGWPSLSVDWGHTAMPNVSLREADWNDKNRDRKIGHAATEIRAACACFR